jgi:hypothetical protein
MTHRPPATDTGPVADTDRATGSATEEPGVPNPWDIYAGRSVLQPLVLAVASLFAGGVIAVAARGFAPSNELVGYLLVGLLLLAPLPMLAGDAVDALLLAAARRGRLSLEAYRRTSPTATAGALVVVGMAVYPVVLAIGGEVLLGVSVIVGAFVLFGALPIGSWLVRRIRGGGGQGRGPRS